MRLPQFDIRDLFWSVTLISLGIGCWVMLPHYVDHISSPEVGSIETLVIVTLIFSGPTFVGSGIAAPFRRKRWGAAFGIVLFTLLFVVLVDMNGGFIPIY